EPELIAEKPQPESESNLFMKQPDKESKQKPVVEKQKQESESKSNKRTKQNSQQESIAEKRKQKLPPSVVQTNEYFDTVNRNMRKLLHGFAQDEVLIINTGKTK
ncbi:MAG: hypothetical protein LBL62_01935, partial [Planctomycetaceae bacterium]|nr:hypothetical protein [Planctomycetaceae bacterium]